MPPSYAADSSEFNCRIGPYTRVDVSSAAEGVLGEILVKKNDIVKKGDILAKLEATLESATLELRELQAELNSDIEAQSLSKQFASRNLARVKNLYEQKAASFAELDKAKTEYEIAIQQLQQASDRKRQAEMEFKRALADLEKRNIHSPIDGIVVERFKEPGEHIYFEPILQIVQLAPLRVEAFAPANLYGKITEGAYATVTPEVIMTQSSFNVKIDQVDKVIDAPSNTFGFSLLLPNPEYEIPSGLKCKLAFHHLSQETASAN